MREDGQGLRLIAWQGQDMGEKLAGLVGYRPLDGKRLDDDMGNWLGNLLAILSLLLSPSHISSYLDT